MLTLKSTFAKLEHLSLVGSLAASLTVIVSCESSSGDGTKKPTSPSNTSVLSPSSSGATPETGVA